MKKLMVSLLIGMKSFLFVQNVENPYIKSIGSLMNWILARCASLNGKEYNMGWITVILAVMYLCGLNVGTALAICALISSLLSLYLAYTSKYL